MGLLFKVASCILDLAQIQAFFSTLNIYLNKGSRMLTTALWWPCLVTLNLQLWFSSPPGVVTISSALNCDKQVNQRKQPMTIPWFEYPRRVSDSAPEFSRFSDIKNLQPNQEHNSKPLESINPTTLRDYWTFCRCAVMTKFFALISSFWSLFFSRPGQDNRPPQCQVGWMWKNPDENDAILRAILRTVPRHESTVFCG